MSRIDDLRAQLAHAEEQERLEQALADAGAAHAASPSDEARSAANRAAEALRAHRAAGRGEGVRVGGDAVRSDGEG